VVTGTKHRIIDKIYLASACAATAAYLNALRR
jgi:hypothetical protein